VRIYTLVGERVHDISADTLGVVTWDAKNSAGQPVSSGVYIVKVEGAGDKKVLKVSAQR